MSESLDGVSFSVTRQKAGSVLNAAAALAVVVFGGVKAPAGMDSADSTRPFVTFSCASDSHAIGDVAVPCNAPSVTAASSAIPAAILMRGVYRSIQVDLYRRVTYRGEDDAPLVTVVVAAYNATWSLDETLASVCAQTYPNLEVLVVDDGSTGATAELATRGVTTRCPGSAHL